MEKVYKVILENALSGNLSEDDAFEAIKLLKGEHKNTEDIAIIGISVNLPLSKNIDDFWNVIRNKIDCVREIPENRRKDMRDLLTYKKNEISNIKYAKMSYLDEIDKFDCNFFGISPREASLMDPNQRLFLQTAWSAIEDAGYGGEKLVGTKTGVYLGFCGESDYGRVLWEIYPELYPVFTAGNLTPIIASRISYLLDLKGPSVLVNTACSSALTAIHYACQGIRNGDCEMAIAGGVKINLLVVESENKLGIESSDGRTKTFDDSSDGTGIGEGVAAILLKPLSKALEDGDTIYAIIKGSAINQDGNSNGITAPNPIAQGEVIKMAWKNARISPETITYIEAHGTGTKLGDPIEIDGIKKAFRCYTEKKQFCAVGSVKTNMGHLDNAAGIAGFVKAVLALKNREIPPSLHFNKPNSAIDFINSPVYVSEQLKKWEVDESPRRCGVSSFGLSGTNCHIVLEEAPLIKEDFLETSCKLNVFTVSAKTQEALLELIKMYREYSKENNERDLKNICYTSNTGRGHYNYRVAIILEKGEGLRGKLERFDLTNKESNRGVGIFYGEYKTVAEIKETKANNEISENDKMKLSRKARIKTAAYVSSGKQDKEVLSDICDLYVQGAQIAWEDLYKGGKNRRVNMPAYPFMRQRCWVKIDNPNSKDEAPEVNKEDTCFHSKLLGRESEMYSDIEINIAKAWGSVLGLEEVNIYDNFFELGGDSLLAVQLISRLLKSFHKNVTMSCLLDNPTIIQLGKVFEKEAKVSLECKTRKAYQGIVQGEVGLTTVQKCFYDRKFTDPQHWTVASFLYKKDGVDEVIIRKAFDKIMEHHDSLRMVYKTEGEKIIQFSRGMGEIEGNLFDLIILDLVNDPDYKEKIQEAGYKLQNSIDLNNGPLVRIGLFKTLEGDHLLITSHHLACDGISLTIVLEDFETAYMQLLNNQEIELQEKTDSYMDWSKQMSIKANSKEFLKELGYWKTLEETKVAELPKDNKVTHLRRSKDDDSVQDFILDEEGTHKLINVVNPAYGTSVQEVLLTGLGLVIKEWTGENNVLVRLGGHGRDIVMGDLYVPRTVGWFGISYPIILNMSRSDSLPAQVIQIKEMLRNIPGKGEGYDILKYSTLPENRGTIEFKLNTEIYFNNLGNIDSYSVSDNALFGISQLPVPASRSLYTEREYTFNFTVFISKGKLFLNIDFDKNEYSKETVSKILESYKRSLQKIINSCQ